ncbi:Transcription factor SOX-6 [Choanephora cucurbitarum]|uniref:Transcription factor SOX-6 n=1 Tax=Choanephora cucurbitarum TaxID=101091 RepID=A0A1C7NJS9_9FUNG|nr:Transcription factor SOX-6 [Choanephora cucurbitarum]
MKATKVEAITFSKDNKGSTILTVFPGAVSIQAKELINMVRENFNEIFIDGSTCILREEILKAIHDYPSDSRYTVSEKSVMSSSNPSKTHEPKRPTNAFIIYNNDHRKKIKMLFPEFNNSEVSKLLGAIWKSIGSEVKDTYIRKAIECRKIHKQKYPHFEYNLKRGLFAQKPSTISTNHSENWDDYFNWCLENVSTQSASGMIREDNLAGLEVAEANEQMEIHFNPDARLCIEKNSQESWEEVYNIISNLLPEEDSRNTFFDEQLWGSLDQITVFNETDSDFIRFS